MKVNIIRIIYVIDQIYFLIPGNAEIPPSIYRDL